jgi:hypothetical protein
MYPLFQTPELNISRTDKGVQVCLGNGYDLFETRLPIDSTDEEVIAKAEHELLSLACRQWFNPIPHMMPFDESAPTIRLTADGVYPIRHAAFLRKNIKYLPQPFIKRLAGSGKEWRVISKAIKEGGLESFEMVTKVLVVSLDAALLVLPERSHGDAIANARVVNPRFFRIDDLYGIADDAKIVIGGAPSHPLEFKPSQVMTTQTNDKLVLTNDLPDPPMLLEEVSAKAKFPLADINAMQERLRKRAEEDRYVVRNQALTRFQFMEYLCWCVTQGKVLSKICTGMNGTPSMIEIAKWRQWHPDFDHDMQVAEKIQANVFADEALEIARDVIPDKEAIAAARFTHKALMERAALQDEKFRQKQVIQTENLNDKNDVEIKRQLVMMLQNNPKVLDMLKPKPAIIDVTPEGA